VDEALMQTKKKAYDYEKEGQIIRLHRDSSFFIMLNAVWDKIQVQ
jgi:hypothetical protein